MNRVPFPVLGALPIVNMVFSCEMTGAQIKVVMERGFSLERGMIQVSGLKAVYDMSKPVGKRKTYKIATNSFVAQGGDLYQTILDTKQE